MGSPLVTFPGTSGNYVSTADVNLLNADTAHSYQAVGNKSTYASGTLVVTPVAVAAAFGGKGTRWTMTWATYNGFRMGYISPYFVVAANTQYTFSFSADLGTNWGTTVRTRVNRNVAGAVDSTVTRIVGAGRYSNTFTTGASDTYITVQVDCPLADGTASGSGTIDVYDVCLRTGTSAVFVPSLRIVGDLDIEAQVALTDWTPAGENCIIALGTASHMPRFSVTPTALSYTHGAVAQYDSTVAIGVTDGTSAVVRMVRDQSVPDVKFYKNGVQLGAAVTVDATNLTADKCVVGTWDLGTNGLLTGDIYYVEVRDGIDGPVVRRFDAEDPLIANLFALNIPNGLTWTGEDTATWTANGADLDVSGEFALTDYLENELADHIAGTGAYTMPTAVYLKLHIGDPGESAATNAAVEATRKVLTFGVAAAGVALNDAAATWTSVSTTETYTHWSLWDALTVGNPLVYGELTYPVAATAGDTIQLPVGGLSVKAR